MFPPSPPPYPLPHSGDLTHAKFPNERSSQQFEEEWQAYNDILRETRVGERRPWLDIRGNHGRVLHSHIHVHVFSNTLCCCYVDISTSVCTCMCIDMKCTCMCIDMKCTCALSRV